MPELGITGKKRGKMCSMHMKETCSRGGSSTCVHVEGLRGHKNSNRAVATTAGSIIRCDDVTYVAKDPVL